MIEGLSPAAIKMLQRKPKVSVELDAETYRLMEELAQQAGGSVADILDKLAAKYQRCNWLEKQAVIHFLNGV
ncbi:MAG: hypothetical protein PHN44_04365 [Candidatus Marinimicrobia bacterium]|nr:hypothetical protein [Candidatus Neomarinimicrobiota bacterium]